jgi:hypothetical protein
MALFAPVTEIFQQGTTYRVVNGPINCSANGRPMYAEFSNDEILLAISKDSTTNTVKVLTSTGRIEHITGYSYYEYFQPVVLHNDTQQV